MPEIEIEASPNSLLICHGEHQKVFEDQILTSNPPKQRWICSRCGTRGIDTLGHWMNGSYKELEDKFWRIHDAGKTDPKELPSPPKTDSSP